MAQIRKDGASAPIFDAIEVEGALISPAMLARIAAHGAGGQSEADYSVPKGLSLRDEIARYFRIAQALFAPLASSETPSVAATTKFVEDLLREVFGFADLKRTGGRTLDGREFAVTLEGLGGRVPIVVVPPADELDRPSDHLPTDGRRRSAASALQDWLNANEAALWGLCSNGSRFRLVRDNASLTRPAYIEADLRAIFEEENFADFTALWLLTHATRFGQPSALPSDCALERWREAGQKEGMTARDRLRDGFEAALLSFGNGFLAHPDNGALREKLRGGELPLTEFFGQLLRLVYRLIFLLAAEDRDLLHPPDVSLEARKLYAAGYSLAALRESAVRRAAWDRHHDRWEGLLITFAALARGEKRLGLPALDGLFAPSTLPDLESTKLANRGLMEAIYRLAWLKDGSGLVPVNWRDMETEELGSVYESLLELTPQLNGDGRHFKFAEGGEAQGHARKTTGSYYTPDGLVQALLDSALDPVLDRIETETSDPAAALLSVSVLDPACGSGHFLLAAARRIATRLGRVRTQGLTSPSDFRHALRDVARACIYGVDRNPMAIELTKVALWIETVEPGKPLGFLDANIRCGDALLGVFDLEALRRGIPDDSYEALSGDDDETANHFKARNRAEREGQGSLDYTKGSGQLPPAAPLANETKSLRSMPEDSPDEIAIKRKRFEAVLADPRLGNLRVAADLFIAAFLTPKIGGVPASRDAGTIPTTASVWDALTGHTAHGPLVASSQEISNAARAFHWPLEFPDIMAGGGFDVVVGNPPWERIKLQEKEFFAPHEPQIAQAPNKAAREHLIAKLKNAAPGTRERALYDAFEVAKRQAEALSVFARVDGENTGRFPLTGRGDINTYALFAELFANLATKRGRAGVIVPTGIATDATTAPFFAFLVATKRLARLVDFENRDAIFAAVHRSYKFSLLTIGHGSQSADFAFFLTDVRQLAESERCFTLSAEEIARINPNSKTAPIFRSRTDADLTAKIYSHVPVIVDESKGKAGNPWSFDYMTKMFDMADSSSAFRTAQQLRKEGLNPQSNRWTDQKGSVWVPLYEAKMIHHFDHRWATYDNGDTRDATEAEKMDPQFESTPRYWLPESAVEDRLLTKNWHRGWLLGWRDICRSTDERTTIATAYPAYAIGHTIRNIFVLDQPRLAAAFISNLSALVLDFVARQKLGGTHLTVEMLKQLPMLPPTTYSPADLDFVVQRTIQLAYTSYSMASFARDLDYDGPPLKWDEDRRSQLRAELDAWYARAYGLSRDELRYILDPADVKGPDYPSETFRVLKTNEVSRFGEYRTAKLVLQAWDRLERGELAA
ncbi:Eco57I restriction-modification methylase domain-containing protein [Bradyrhizobium liaoningense]|uniref:Eco57I restriction-modification methylase domain-containing protein n=1 Tax=Bradyrhizobium liaoningense TaxID=43992 RepID=UPI001BAB4F7D|nr:N-6 DNA methylase [Bradyrhizobium liaoningense]MBR1032964.1 N-6 DNA methylase [Bradyrhizobium liaoningense]